MPDTFKKWFGFLAFGLIPFCIIATSNRFGEEKLPPRRGQDHDYYPHRVSGSDFRLRIENDAVVAGDTQSLSHEGSDSSRVMGDSLDRPATLPADFSAQPTSGCSPLIVHFTNESADSGVSYRWNFGDGATSSTKYPVHQFTSPGRYTISLAVLGSDSTTIETKTDYVVVDVRPTAAFSCAPTGGAGPLTANFTDRSNHPEFWFWDFGDGQTSTEQNPTHRYTAAGTYTVALKVTNGCGSDQETGDGLIRVDRCSVPSAEFVGSPIYGCVPLKVDFADRSIGADSWSWDFGDGGKSDEENLSYVYRKAGKYSVTLAVSNSCGCDQRVKTGYVIITRTPQKRMHVKAIEVSLRSWWVFKRATAKVQIADAEGSPVGGVSVTGRWSNDAGNVCGFTTGPDGWGSIQSQWYNGTDDIAFCVTEAAKPKWMHDNKADEISCSVENEFTSVSRSTTDVNIWEIETALKRPLAVNYPNPFNVTTEIGFYVPQAVEVSVGIYNAVGRRVRNLLNSFVSAGTHSVIWNGTDDNNRPVASGVYFYRITFDSRESIVKKMVLMK